MAEVIAFLIEHFGDFDACPSPGDLGYLLEEMGFGEVEIGNVLMLMDVLFGKESFSANAETDSLRVYSAEELDVLPQEVLGLIHFLEKAGAVNGNQRELIVHALLHMPPEDINVDMAKVLTLLVLWAQKSELPVLVGDELMMALYGKTQMH
ncbi:DUF494 family protein [Neisseria weaveri]|uniref:Protein Smg homolog n=1 Tax=Neisseria weaveri TaxID=28091 RepID=A0A448VNK8_9NEIS|nr:DUF494 family protein [Neisseria weaveri]EGV35081.1 hypothetical protein l11_20870 [Neisseria weaveri LMG 5135]EGV36249.1 hypothetical protein l13_10070 [Neisseria weaveri ATCC 51223]SAY51972.1 Protein smg-like protein [Neisseria weaveri]VEJ51389.1 Protein smg-like protein [Neisseria weaveri]